MNRLVVGAVLGPGPVTLVEIATQIQNGARRPCSGSAYAVTPVPHGSKAGGDRERLRDLVVTGPATPSSSPSRSWCDLGLLVGPVSLCGWASSSSTPCPSSCSRRPTSAVTAPSRSARTCWSARGRVGAVVRAAGWGMALNLALSLRLVAPSAPRGPFVATLVGAMLSCRILGRAVLEMVDLDRRAFVATPCSDRLEPRRVGGAGRHRRALARSAALTIGLGDRLGITSWSPRSLSLAPGELRGLCPAGVARRHGCAR